MNAGHWITSLVKRILNLPTETDQRPTHQPTLHVTRLEPRFVLNGSPVPLDPQGMNQQVHDVGPALGTANLMVVQAPDTPQLVNSNGPQATGGSELRLVREGIHASVLVDGLHSGEVGTDGGLLVRGGPGAETLVIDFSGGNPIPVGGMVFEGGAGFDQVQIVGGSVNHVAASLSENGSGRLEIDGRVIEFRGVESVIDHLESANRTIALSGTNDAQLTAGTPGAGQELRLAFSDSTEFRFNAARDSLSINLGSESSSDTRISDAVFQGPHVSIVGGSEDRVEFSGHVTFAADTVHVSAGEIDIAGSIVANTSASHDASIVCRMVSVDLNAVRSLNFHTDSNVTLAGGRLLADAGRGGTLILDGNLDASTGDSGGSGGSITLLGARVGLGSTARIDVSGPVAGQVLIGGAGPEARGSLPASERLSVVSGATIHADGVDSGSGGRVVLWSETATRYQGFISVQAGARGGDGGLVEVSSGGLLLFRGDVNLTAAHGTQGTLLLDPLTITIADQKGGANDALLTDDNRINFSDTPPNAFTISETTLESLSGTIVLQARDKIALADLTTDGVLTLKDHVNLVLQTSNDTGNAVTQPGITFDNVANTIRPVTNGSISITMMAGVTIDSSGKVLTTTGTGLISVGNLLTGGGDLLLGASQNVLFKGNVDSGTGTIRATADNGIIQVATGMTVQSANTATDAIILKSNTPEIGTNAKVQATGTAGGIVVRSSNNNTMSIGGSSGFVAISDDTLKGFQTKSTGTITFGDDQQTADIKIQTASFSNVGTIRVVQSTTGSGRIILNDEGTGIALNGGSSAISLTTGNGGIVAATSSNTFAEIATTGPTVTLNTAGGIGEKSATVNRPIQIAPNSSTTQQMVVIGSTNAPTSPVYLEGLGALTLGSATLPTTDLYVTAKGAVAEATGAAINASLLSVTTRNDSGAAITLNGPGNTATNIDFSVLKSATTDAANAEIAYTSDAGSEIVNVKTAGTATLTARGAVTQSGAIVATTLRVTTRNDSGAAITLDGTGNTATNVEFSALKSTTTDAANADITYTGNAGFNLVNVKTAGTVTLTAQGAVTEENDGNSIVATKLLLLGSGSYDLSSKANDVDLLAADSSGSVTYQDANSFTVDEIGTVQGISATAAHLLAKTNLTIAKNITSTTGVIELSADSDGDGTGTLKFNDKTTVSSGLTVPGGSSEAVILSGAAFDFGTKSTAKAAGAGGGVAIRPSVSTRKINLGTGGGAGDLIVDDTFLSHIAALDSGFIAVGDSTQVGDIKISRPTFGTTGEIRVLQSTAGNGQIILDDANTAIALDGGNRNIVLTAGTKGVASVHGTHTLAEIATTGAKVTINTQGEIGSSASPLQFAGNANLTQQNVTIGDVVQPTSNVYLGGLGALTLGSIRLSGADLDVRASGAVAEANGASITAKTLSVTTRKDDGASINLANTGNQVTNLALGALKSSSSVAANAQLSYSSSTGVTISSLNTAGTAILVLGGDVDQKGGISARILQVTTRNDAGAAIDLSGSGNAVSRINLNALKSATTDAANGDITFVGDVASNANVDLEIININTAGTATLTVHGAVTQSGEIVADTLSVTTRDENGAAITLNGLGNSATKVDFSVLKSATTDAAAADVAYTGDAGFEIVNVKTAGTATLTASGAVTQSGGIVANTLSVTTRNANGAAITLNGPGNTATKVDFSVLKSATTDAANGNVVYTGDAGFEIVNVTTAGAATLTSSGAVTQSGGIVANTLSVTTRNANG
ncbi:MAG: hypothetical protein NT069_21900, partial [Planctomycetota bacterium]|nr:hypothetical protein [Planctomycetota bacterium]